MHWFARMPHYRRHLGPILDGLFKRGVELTEGIGGITLVAGLPDAARCNRVILLEHGAGQTYQVGGETVDPSGSNRPEPNIELYLAPSQRMADHMARKLPNARRVVVGSPAVERFVQRYQGGDRIGFAVHWPSPLGREAGTSWPWSARILSALVSDYGDRVVAHAHPRFAHRFARELPRYRLKRVEIAEDWDEMAQTLGVLVADNSSIVWEADAAGIPVVLMDPPHWRADAPHGLRWGPEASHLPRITGDIAPVAAAFETGRLESDHRVYDRIDGATDAACDAIIKYLGDECAAR